MRIAILSDIHGNRTAFEAVLKDLRETAPDLVLHGGDLADSGSSGAWIVDRIRDLGWPGIIGNTDEMLAVPKSFDDFAAQSPQLAAMWAAIREIAAASRDRLGDERVAWLGSLPRTHVRAPIALVHASPKSVWRSPQPEAGDADLEAVYGGLGQPIAVYGHVHRPYIRNLPGLTVVNSGSVGLPYDGDPRAAYLLLDDGVPSTRRVAYDVDKEVAELKASGMPYHEWIARTIVAARPQALP
ncbi:MAG TPA: metallophosphoesterase family protein [Bryobacteraceae bacterium]|jgi:predicted phosphodiesterase